MSTIILPVTTHKIENAYPDRLLQGIFEIPKEWENTSIRFLSIQVYSPCKSIKIFLKSPFFDSILEFYPFILNYKMKKPNIIDLTGPLNVSNPRFTFFLPKDEELTIDDLLLQCKESYIKVAWDYEESLTVCYKTYRMAKYYDFTMNKTTHISSFNPIILENLYIYTKTIVVRGI